MDWIKTSEQRPEMHRDLEVMYGHGEVHSNVRYMEDTHCMLAGIAGGSGYFNRAGFGCNGKKDDYGLDCGKPEFWRYAE